MGKAVTNANNNSSYDFASNTQTRVGNKIPKTLSDYQQTNYWTTKVI